MSTPLAADHGGALTDLEVELIRRDFPIFEQKIHGNPLVYLDSAVSAQKPRAVIDAIAAFYANDYGNIHRGVYELSLRATSHFDTGRRKVANFVGAGQDSEIVFVRNATEAINLVAATFGHEQVGEGDEVLVTHMEHHANLVPWQQLCLAKGAHLRVAPIDDTGELILEEFEKRLSSRTRIVAVPHVSNSLGTVVPVKRIVELAHAAGAAVLIDGAQALPRMPVDVRALDCDFYVFSGHKLYGPTGIGVLYGKQAVLEEMPPYMTGGDMIASVTLEETLFQDPPARFEAGTPDIAGVVGLGAAIDYLTAIGMERIEAREGQLFEYLTEAVAAVPGVRLIGTASERCGVLSFVVDGIHPHDLGTILDRRGVAIRAGHHCAQPTMKRFGVTATARASLGVYNTREDVDALVRGLHGANEMFR